MAKDYGFKVSKPGYDVLSADPTQLVFSSKYPTLRVQQQGSGVITHSGGRTATIAHNLGYVPRFVCHGDLLKYFYDGALADYFYLIPGSLGGNIGTGEETSFVHSWADSTNLYISVSDNYAWDSYFATITGNRAIQYISGGTVLFGYSGVGVTANNINGAIRFANIDVDQGVTPYLSQLVFYIDFRGESGDIKFNVVGIKETNTPIFEAGNDGFSRAQTSASVAITTGSGAQAGTTDTWPIKPIITEIFAQGGWSNGNALGMNMWEDDSDDDNYFSDSPGGGVSKLEILLSNTLLNYKYTIFKDKIE